MTEIEIKDYRKLLEKEYSDKDLEIDNLLTYVTVGSLGFFLTINDKFLKLVEANSKYLLIISLILLFFSFVLLLIRKSLTMKNNHSLITLIDNTKPNSEASDQELLNHWNKSHRELSTVRTLVYVLLSFGIGLQILFFFFNL